MPRRDFLKRTQHRGYQRQRYHNPYFAQTKRPWPWKAMGISVGVAVLLGVGIEFLFGSSTFAIHRIEVLGLQKTPRAAFEEKVIGKLASRTFVIFRQSNMFLLDEQSFGDELKTAFNLAEISIARKESVLSISIVERSSHLLWKAGDQTVIVDLSGTVVREATPEDLGIGLPVFVDVNDVPVELGTAVLTTGEIEQVFTFQKRIGESPGLKTQETLVNRLAGKWMSLKVMDGYEVYFDALGDIEAQANRLQTLLVQKIVDPTSIEYIDLRFGDQVYYK